MNAPSGRAEPVGQRAGKENSEIRCFSCGALVPDSEGPAHRYMLSAPGCWHRFGEVLAREYENRDYWPLHRLTVDCFAVQHPGEPNPQAIQSVAVHLISLYMVLERNVPPERSTRLLKDAVKSSVKFHWLEPPDFRGERTVMDVHATSTAQAHLEAVRAWAESCWQAWSDHRETIQKWLPFDQASAR